MPLYERPCDVHQGYSFQKDVQTTVGFIKKLKLGDADLAADQVVKSPLAPADDLKVVAVMSHVSWNVGASTPVFFAGQISVKNRQTVAKLVYTSMTKIAIEIDFVVFEFDPAGNQNKYYQAFHSDGKAVKALVHKEQSNLSLSVAYQPSEIIKSPMNYDFQIGLVPQVEKQNLQMAVSVDGKFSVVWSSK